MESELADPLTIKRWHGLLSEVVKPYFLAVTEGVISSSVWYVRTEIE